MDPLPVPLPELKPKAGLHNQTESLKHAEVGVEKAEIRVSYGTHYEQQSVKAHFFGWGWSGELEQKGQCLWFAKVDNSAFWTSDVHFIGCPFGPKVNVTDSESIQFDKLMF